MCVHTQKVVRLSSEVRTLVELKNHVEEQAESVIFSLAQTIEARDPTDGGHSSRVSNQAVQFGKRLGLSQDDLEILRVGGLVHDIGKIGVPESILSKPGPLDADEIRIVQQHPILGEHICEPLASLQSVLPIIRHHHERLNGSGYPDGLRGDEIPLTVRVLQIVDICDALTANRSYRINLSLSRALIILYEEADRGWLDPALVSQYASFVIGSDHTMTPAKRERPRMVHSGVSGRDNPLEMFGPSQV